MANEAGKDFEDEAKAQAAADEQRAKDRATADEQEKQRRADAQKKGTPTITGQKKTVGGAPAKAKAPTKSVTAKDVKGYESQLLQLQKSLRQTEDPKFGEAANALDPALHWVRSAAVGIVEEDDDE